jgi:uncharacterized peroxidase-related enzyme
MPHISLSNNLPGIRSLVAYRPDSGKILYELAEALLRNDSPIPASERELIAAYVSSLNECRFCAESHAAASRALFKSDIHIVNAVLADYKTAPVSDKLKALLTIAGKVQKNGRLVNEKDIEQARMHGSNDREIHDTVLIAAAFSMFNRYVDGLATWAPDDAAAYEEMGQKMAEYGYARRFNNVVNEKKHS